ncbi:MAG TPA: ATP-binding protein [Gammaproteobacteria bacterium]|nr:ATP-binding protein [Gammaproteobacteria bacterium]
MKHLSFESRLAFVALAGGAPALILAGWLLLTGDLPFGLAMMCLSFALAAWLGFSLHLKSRLTYHLNTLSNLLEALREEDYSLRSRRAREHGALGDVFREVNFLSKTLREQRVQAREASALLRKVLAEIDIAVFAFDGTQRLMLVNRAGERLMHDSANLGDTAPAMKLDDLLVAEGRQIVARRFPGGSGRWDVWTGRFRQAGLPHYLLVVSDLSRALREEERKAWQRLVRVMGHELNNSLTPIKSMASTLHTRLDEGASVDSLREDLRASLDIIASRAEALGRFMTGYTMLARLPAPRRRTVRLRALVERAAAIDTRLRVAIEGDDTSIPVDPDQLEQLIINLVKNAADAGGPDGTVQVRWARDGDLLRLEVLDSGPGLSGSDNLFVPFFTTKPGGTGIGLVLCRQIAEAHDGALALENRDDGPGCIARLELPLA